MHCDRPWPYNQKCEQMPDALTTAFPYTFMNVSVKPGTTYHRYIQQLEEYHKRP